MEAAAAGAAENFGALHRLLRGDADERSRADMIHEAIMSGSSPQPKAQPAKPKLAVQSKAQPQQKQSAAAPVAEPSAAEQHSDAEPPAAEPPAAEQTPAADSPEPPAERPAAESEPDDWWHDDWHDDWQEWRNSPTDGAQASSSSDGRRTQEAWRPRTGHVSGQGRYGDRGGANRTWFKEYHKAKKNGTVKAFMAKHPHPKQRRS